MRVDRWFVLGLAVVSLVGIRLRRPSAEVTKERVNAESIDSIVQHMRADADGRVRGARDAGMHLIELLDLECEACAEVHRVLGGRLDGLVAAGRLRHTVYDHPLPVHPNAVAAAVILQCGSEIRPSSAWPLQSALLLRQAEWASASDAEARLLGIAESVGLPGPMLAYCWQDRRAASSEHLQQRSGWLLRQGASYSPFFIANGEHVLPREIAERLREIEDFRP